MNPAARAAGPAWQAETLRRDFPALAQRVHGRPLVYLDSAATSQKPQLVLDAVQRFLAQDCANVHRGVHCLSMRATEVYEAARTKVQRFIGAGDAREIVFLRSATEGVNLVAQAWGREHLGPGDEVLVTHLEHHSNLVPWQMVCKQTGAALKVAPVNDRGELLLDEFQALLGPRTRLVAATWVSNALGTINPVREMTEMAHRAGARVLLDAAQAAPHLPVDVQAAGCDFLVLTGHKMYAPTGAGVLFGHRDLLEAMPPWQGGGEMIRSVTLEETVFSDLPHKFEAGTPDIAAVYGLGAAVDYLQALGMPRVAAWEQRLLEHATAALREVPGLRILGEAARKTAVISFLLEGVHPHDAGTILDQEGIAVRTGHHCAQPVMKRFGVPATIRASFGLYNTPADVDALVAGLARVREVFGT